MEPGATIKCFAPLQHDGIVAGGVPMHCSNVATATLEQCIGTPPARRRQFSPEFNPS